MSHQPRKRFGQNFLHDQNIIRKIVHSLGAKSTDHVVEIGPGQGAITAPLLETGARLDVVELDRDLILPLQELAKQQPRLSVHNADALKFDFSTLATTAEKIRVIGNLPYNISTPLIFHLLSYQPYIQDLHIMLQKEVIDRMAAAAGDDDYGRLSVMVQYRCKVIPLFNISNQAFFPVPKVESSFARLVPHATPPVAVSNENDLARTVQAAFAQRRKTLRNSLRSLVDDVAIRNAGVEPNQRAEELTLEDFARLANQLTERGDAITSA